MTDALLEAIMYVIHIGYGALWTGAILFLVLGIVPAAKAGSIAPAAFGLLVSRLTWITRIGAVIFLVTGGHLAGSRYTIESLTGTGRGHLVLTMLGLWLVLTIAIEAVSARLSRGLEDGDVARTIGKQSGVVVGSGDHRRRVARLRGTPRDGPRRLTLVEAVVRKRVFVPPVSRHTIEPDRQRAVCQLVNDRLLVDLRIVKVEFQRLVEFLDDDHEFAGRFKFRLECRGIHSLHLSLRAAVLKATPPVLWGLEPGHGGDSVLLNPPRC